MVDAYQEVEDRVVFLRNLARALKPTGRIGIVNWKPGRGGPGPGTRTSASSEPSVEADAARGRPRVWTHENLPYQYLLVLAAKLPAIDWSQLPAGVYNSRP